MIEKTFVKEGIKRADMEEFLAKKFEKAGYSHTEISRTPLGTRIVVYAYKPGIVVGKSGRKIGEIVEEIKEKFGFENPMLDVREVDNPFLDANIVARRIARALEKGINYKKVVNYYLEKIMEAGAVGVEIRVGGKLAGVERSRFQKFKKGFIVHSGDYKETLVDKGYAQAMIKPGIIGIQVEIMKEAPKELLLEKGLEGKEFKYEEEIEKKEETSGNEVEGKVE
ncbi:MAG: 30S ribosomal protein S3 [Candidatus Aenigmatarchaeota archaeon]